LQRLAEAEARLALGSSPADSPGFRIFSLMFQGLPAEYLGFFATEFVKAEKAVAVLASEDGSLLFAQHSSAGRDMAQLLKQTVEKFGGKGGGTRDFARGKLAEMSQASAALVFALERLRGEEK
jgi:alanyl-tRNA synthetase